MQQTLWLLKQLHKTTPATFLVNIRCIHNLKPYVDDNGKTQKKTTTTLNEHIPWGEFEKVWANGLAKQTLELNCAKSPSNVYFAINPLKEKGNKKEHYAYFTAFYLDLDSHGGYTKEQRWLQIQYWIALGFPPSVVIDSGNGYHVYWFLSKTVDREFGETLLKTMVKLADCNEGGNTYDISRVYRLPGFYNVKEWFNHTKLDENPVCGIIWPQNYEQLPEEQIARYEATYFHGFPPSSLKDLQGYYTKAQQLAKSPEEFAQIVKQILAEAAEAYKQLSIKQTATEVTTKNVINAANKTPWEPKLTVVPMISDIKWSKKHPWIKKFVVGGYAALSQGELDEMKVKHGFTDTSCSQLDFLVMYELCSKGYTKEAIREFWTRAGHKIHRPDKEAKNANYFDMTYDKAFGFVKAAFETQQNTKQLESDVWDDNYLTLYRDSKDNVEVVLSFQIRINAIFVDEDAPTPAEREHFDITCLVADPTDPNGCRAIQMFIPNTAFNDIRDLKKYFCHDTMRVLTNSNAVLQKIARYLMVKYRNVKRSSFHSQIVYKDERFVFPTFEITKDKFITRESVPMTEAMKRKFPLYGKFNVEFIDKQIVVTQMQKHWGAMLKAHLPPLICATIGSIVASAIKPIFEEMLGINFHVPTVNIRGGSHTAKTETHARLMTLTGMGVGASTISVTSSQFSLARYLSSTNFVPIVIDEFREDSQDQDNRKSLAMIRRLARGIYSGETLLRGRQDLSVVHMKLHGGMFVIGETPLERVGDIAEVTRVFPVQTDMYSPTQHLDLWDEIKNLSWSEVAPYFYQYVLQLDPQQLYALYEMLYKDAVTYLSRHFSDERLRIAHNIAALWLGCRVFDAFAQQFAPGAALIEHELKPRETLLGSFCSHSMAQEQTLKLEQTNAETGATELIVVANNEATSLIKLFGVMIETGDRHIKQRSQENGFIYRVDKEKDLLALNFETMHRAVTEYCIRLNRPTPPNATKLGSLFRAAVEKKQPWIKDIHAQVRCNGQRVRVMLLPYQRCVDMGLWPDETLLVSENVHEGPTDAPENKTLGNNSSLLS